MKNVNIEFLFDLLMPILGTIAVLVPLGILGYLIVNGARVIDWTFLTEFPRQLGKEGGIFPTIVASLVVVPIAVVVSVPLGLGAAVYLSEYAPRTRWVELLHLGMNILAGMPSILFGMLGYTLLVVALHLGWSILSGSLTLAFMLMPTIAKITTEALDAIPKQYQEEALILGATKWDYVTKIGLPLISRSIIASLVLSIGRATGETAALILTVGSALKVPLSLLHSARPMSIHILLLAKEGISLERAFGTSLVLLIVVGLMNVIATWLMQGRTDVIAISSG
jgi:phosphate transport system permease protein